MIFFLILKHILCGGITLLPNEDIEFDEEFKQGQLVKFEFTAEDNAYLEVKITTDTQAIIAEYNESYVTLHFMAPYNSAITFSFVNNGDKAVQLWFLLPDVTKEVLGPLGPVVDVDYVSEFKNILESIFTSQQLHISKQAEHTKNVEANKRAAIYFFLIEFCFNFVLIVYFHKHIIGLFEKKRRI